MGCDLFAKELVQTFRVKTDHHFITDDDGGRGTAAIFINQVLNRDRIASDVALFELCTSRREVGRGSLARRSTGLGEYHDLLIH